MCPNRTRKVLLVVAVIVSTQSISAYAQLSLDIRDFNLALRMDRQTVLTRLKNYRVDCLNPKSGQPAECDELLVMSDGSPFDVYAGIVFQRDKIKSIRKYWSRGYEGTDPGKFAQTLYSLLSNAGQTTFQISVSERRDLPGVVWQTIFLTSGRRTISISYQEGLRASDGRIIPAFVSLDDQAQRNRRSRERGSPSATGRSSSFRSWRSNGR